MRIFLALTALATPAAGWEAIPGPICRLTHVEAHASVELTYDPSGPLYSITVTRADGAWAPAPVFGITFDGPAGLTITTNRQQLAGPSVSVADTGFGNVLNGLQYNQTATAMLGDQAVTLSLDGAAPEVEAFRACTTTPIA